MDKITYELGPREVVGYGVRGSLLVEWSDWTRESEEIGVPLIGWIVTFQNLGPSQDSGGLDFVNLGKRSDKNIVDEL